MEPLKSATFFSPRNVPFWAAVVLVAILAGMISWLS